MAIEDIRIEARGAGPHGQFQMFPLEPRKIFLQRRDLWCRRAFRFLRNSGRFQCGHVKTAGPDIALDVLCCIFGSCLVLADVLTDALALVANEQPPVAAILWFFADGYAHLLLPWSSLRLVCCCDNDGGSHRCRIFVPAVEPSS